MGNNKAVLPPLIPIRLLNILECVPAEHLWKGVTSVSNAGRKRGRGKGAGKKMSKDLNKGQVIGIGKANMVWPGLSAPIIRGRELIQQQKLPEDPEREAKLIKLRDEMGTFRYMKLSPIERGWTGAKMPGRSIGPPDAIGEDTFEGFDSKVLELKTIFNMKGNFGRTRRISVIAVTGNRNGLAGFALAKSTEIKGALRQAKNRAGQKLMNIDIYNGHTVYHDFFTQFGKTKIYVSQKPKGYGLVCHRAIKSICEVIGIKDLHAKIEGSTNLQHIVKAFFLGVLQQKTHAQIAEEKKLHLIHQFRYNSSLVTCIMSSYLTSSIFLFIFVIINSTVLSSAEDCDKSIEPREKPVSLKLQEELLCDYDKTVRPVLAHTNTTIVDIKFVIKHVDLLEYSNAISVECWFAMKWVDEHMEWKPEDYEDTNKLFLTTEDIWVPDLSVYNKFAYSNSKIVDDSAQCLVNHNKIVICIPQTTIEGNCVPDLRHWPFDEQNCTIKIGSWYHHGKEIDFNDTEVIVQDYIFRENGEWTLKNVSQRKDPGLYACCPNDTYPSLLYSFILQRNAGTIVAAVIIPIFIFILISIMTLWLDPKTPERIYLIALNIPCHIIYLHNVSWEITEPGDSVPYVILMLRDSLLLVALTLIETVVVRCLLDTKKDSPTWLVTSFMVLVNSKPGQMILFSELNPENAVANISADDSENLVEVQTERPKEWYLLGRVIDRVYFATYIITYFIMIIVCIPK
ncbi:mitochondrial ribosomal protein S5 [Carabus blaptoides fortunei]